MFVSSHSARLEVVPFPVESKPMMRAVVDSHPSQKTRRMGQPASTLLEKREKWGTRQVQKRW